MNRTLFKSGIYDPHERNALEPETCMAPAEFQSPSTDLTEVALMERHFSIGMFDTLSQAQHAVSDAVSHGVEKRDITVVVSDDIPEASRSALQDISVVHPGDDSLRGYAAGGIGGAVGAFAGALTMFFLGQSAVLPSMPGAALGFGGLCGAVVGAGLGAGVARMWPSIMSVLMHRPLSASEMNVRGSASDNNRSMAAGMLGGLFGSVAGIIASYLVGIPDMHFFIGMGFFAGACATVVGSLVGGMSGRGLSSASMGHFEQLADDGHSVLVSINCAEARRPEIKAMMLNDGAKLVREA